ncbi:hypothetical protein [Mongoliibacter ruber]|uniref:Uncharacterized protein n=1 Tax=Mongoliibacter ruber TaxID=1750599 RepID=A0A2T0WV99_9BACT|nr:hypothetical protein [Mongoliibacter ruber]PRY90599.1 hypothetical protein CLW00_101263 [Mongoliibacter ruber]
MITVYDNAHFVLIKVFDKKGGNLLQIIRWDDMRFEIRNKWDWYFKYRAALAQVQHPKAHVEFKWGHCESSQKTLDQQKINKLRAKKGKVTEYKNKLAKVVTKWDSLFPIEEDQRYINTINKIASLEAELKVMEADL